MSRAAAPLSLGTPRFPAAGSSFIASVLRSLFRDEGKIPKRTAYLTELIEVIVRKHEINALACDSHRISSDISTFHKDQCSRTRASHKDPVEPNEETEMPNLQRWWHRVPNKSWTQRYASKVEDVIERDFGDQTSRNTRTFSGRGDSKGVLLRIREAQTNFGVDCGSHVDAYSHCPENDAELGKSLRTRPVAS